MVIICLTLPDLILAIATPAKNILVLVDNSGSMKKNDPEFLVKKAIIKLVSSLDSSTRLGIYLFDEKLSKVMPLTLLDNGQNRNKCIGSLDLINYRGAMTDLPAAMERALYELKHNSDSRSFKSIIFITDGFIDLGDKTKDAENRKWLIENFADDAKKSGIIIFGVAFTENADFQLIQSLTTKTDGEYYRALNNSDIEPVFDKILQSINSPKTETVNEDIPSVVIINPEDGTGINYKMVFLILGGTLALLLVFFLLIKKSHKSKVEQGYNRQKPNKYIPQAKLIDLDRISGKDEIIIADEITTIGRAEGNTLCLLKAEKNVSGLSHAQIVFKDNLFFLKDLSTNYTKLNDEKLGKKEYYRLKNGDIIGIMKYRFQFFMPETIGQTEIFTEQGSGIRKSETTIESQGEEEKSLQNMADSNKEIGLQNNKKTDEKDTGKPSGLKVVKNKSSIMDEDRQPEKKDKENEATLVKPDCCPNHPDKKPTDICMECFKPFCNECLQVIDNKLICKECAAKHAK